VLLVLLAMPVFVALAETPDEDDTITIAPVVVQVPEEEVERRRTIDVAMREHDIPRDLAADIHDIAREEGVPPAVAFALVRVESEYDERAVSHAGARGLTQVMPATARYLDPDIRLDDLFDRRTNLRLGFRYLRMMLDRYDDDLRLALLAYNRGPGTVTRHLARGVDPGNGFALRVFDARPGSAAAE
jgi:soluble lytic murein transglycosylase-like protein